MRKLRLIFSSFAMAMICSLMIIPLVQAQTSYPDGPQIGAFLPNPNQYNPNPWNDTQFEQLSGHNLDIFLWYQDWTGNYSAPNPPVIQIASEVASAASAGHTIQLAWEPHEQGAPYVPSPQCSPTAQQGQLSLQCMAQGGYDASLIIPWADALKNFKDAQGNPYTVLFRPMCEMNGDWVDWGTTNPTNSYYIQAWQHIHDVFYERGASNVIWVWSPNRDGSTTSAQNTFNNYYPGNNCLGSDGQRNHPCVDIIGIDGYNFGTECTNPTCGWVSNWQNLGQVFGPSYDVFAHNQQTMNMPIMIAEMSSTENGGDKASWITSAYTSWLPYRFPRVVNVTWFNERKPEGLNGGSPIIDWSIASSTESQQAFQSAMQSLNDHTYFMNWYDNIGGDNWVMIANPGVNNVSADLSIPGVFPGDTSITIPLSINPQSTGLFARSNSRGGPVKITTHNNTNVIVSQRMNYPKGYSGNSFEEILARDYNNLSSLYYWPWYDTKDSRFSSGVYIQIANINPFEIYYEIKIGEESNPCLKNGGCGTISPSGTGLNSMVFPTFANIQSGPVEVQTWVSEIDESGNQKKLSPAFSVPSQRLLFNGNALNDTPGTSASELSDHYIWTWYDLYDPRVNGDWIVVTNPSTSETVTAVVSFFDQISGTPVNVSHNIAPGDTWPFYFPGKRGGPVEIKASLAGFAWPSNKRSVIASQRVIWGPSFDEVPGMPFDALSSEYFWTWYDQSSRPNVQDWLLIGNPNAAQVTYTVKLNGVTQPCWPCTLSGGETAVLAFSPPQNGPLEIVSSGGSVVTSRRILWNGYFDEVWGTKT
ncbi:MAG: hypothetical protein HZB44_04505 [Actinobacteria bacterium]|nr:hypothetical protein [Actinomycetota bacterium]